MKTLFALTMMQLKNKLDVSGKSFKTYLFKAVFALIKFAVLTALIYFVFFFLERMGWLSLERTIPQEVMVILFSLILLLTLITCIIKIKDSLYFSTDNTFLLTMPVGKMQLFMSKIILFLIYEFIKNFSFMAPIFIAYGMIEGYPVIFYLWIILCIMLITLLIVSLSGLLSIFAMAISIFLKKHLWLKTLISSIVILACVFGIIKLIALLPDHFDFVGHWATIFWEIQHFMKTFVKYSWPVTQIINFVLGNRLKMSANGISNAYIDLFTANTLKYFLFIVLAIVVIFTLTFILVRPLFFKMASSPFEFKKKYSKKQKSNIKTNSFMSFLKKEILLTLRTPEKINPMLLVSVAMPVIIFLMNKIYCAMETDQRGDAMVIAFNVLMITLLATTQSAMLCTSYTEEGAGAYLLKINPNRYIKSLFPKLILNMFLTTVSTVSSVIIFAHFRNIDTAQTIMIFLIVEFVFLAHAFWSAEIDIMNPKTDEFANSGTVINNPNEVKASLISFIISIFLAVFTFVNLRENSLNIMNAWKKILIATILIFAIRLYLYIVEIKVFFEEK